MNTKYLKTCMVLLLTALALLSLCVEKDGACNSRMDKDDCEKSGGRYYVYTVMKDPPGSGSISSGSCNCSPMASNAVCGNDKCETSETKDNCPQDCSKDYCNLACMEQGYRGNADCRSDGISERIETHVAGSCCCIGDRTAKCGNGLCDKGENDGICPQDCGNNANCITVGQIGNTTGGDSCCPGLTATTAQYGPDGIPLVDPFKCVILGACGNGNCESGETASNCPQDCQQNVGGNCSYKEFPGTCTAVNPVGNDGSLNYVFVPSGIIDVSGTFLNSSSQLNPYNGFTDSSPEAIIRVGKAYDCTLKVEERGTCTPVIVVFTGPVCGKTYAAPLSDNQKTECANAGGLMRPVAVPCPSTGCSQSYYACYCAKCGNGVCEGNETASSCSQDCDSTMPACGNGKCETGETAAICPQDCSHLPGNCQKEGVRGTDIQCCPGLSAIIANVAPVGNGECLFGPGNDRICAKCGDGVCGIGENACNCWKDCDTAIKPFCGNGKCDMDETEKSCPTDCFCGDGRCDENGESTLTCPQDCGSSTVPVCGNGKCETGEKSINCPKDCYCGDGLCDPSETYATCAKDCLDPCLGAGQVIYTYTGGEITFWSARGCCQGLNAVEEESGQVVCVKPNCAPEGVTVSSSDGKYNGCCAWLQQNWLPFGGTPSYTCTKCGNGICEKGETSANCLQDCACVAEGAVSDGSHLCCEGFRSISTALQLDSWGHCQVIAGSNICTKKCGDSVCNGAENKCNCPEDCGKPISYCGNYQCENGETIDNCAIDCEPRAMKPVIYLYPQKPETVNVLLNWDGKIVADYPDYDPTKGWEVTAYPDGHLINLADGREYSYLFWEGSSYGNDYDMSQGFVVKGSDTKQFLQDTLAKIGLTPREYNEFIVYWYPRMKDNPYNIIHFAGTEYTSKAKLTITPQPDSMLRIFMVFKPSQTIVSVTPQTFMPFERFGFTMVEWGGSVIE